MGKVLASSFRLFLFLLLLLLLVLLLPTLARCRPANSLRHVGPKLALFIPKRPQSGNQTHLPPAGQPPARKGPQLGPKDAPRGELGAEVVSWLVGKLAGKKWTARDGLPVVSRRDDHHH